jgi:hypothetical protein
LRACGGEERRFPSGRGEKGDLSEVRFEATRVQPRTNPGQARDYPFRPLKSPAPPA